MSHDRLITVGCRLRSRHLQNCNYSSSGVWAEPFCARTQQGGALILFSARGGRSLVMIPDRLWAFAGLLLVADAARIIEDKSRCVCSCNLIVAHIAVLTRKHVHQVLLPHGTCRVSPLCVVGQKSLALLSLLTPSSMRICLALPPIHSILKYFHTLTVPAPLYPPCFIIITKIKCVCLTALCLPHCCQQCEC
jgi:hypothetical protein